ncbi:hypothetical protein [Anaerostipes sp.]|uniref:hypothetical protein n=1 Tax=Anaerostipes sp. TaxID=1872530 RepID=UPI0025B7C1FE|nr:hypothetical protein [Anaerostipes sp.]MBS7008043.1 hypothetical protein [Anaerostipes sp.]
MKKLYVLCFLIMISFTACSSIENSNSTAKDTKVTERETKNQISWGQGEKEIQLLIKQLKEYLKENHIKYKSIEYGKGSYDKYGIFPEDQINDQEKKYLPDDVCYFLVFVPEGSGEANPATAVFVRDNKTWKLSNYYNK